MLIRSSAAATAARLTFAAFAIVTLYASAQAANVTFVAANGNDANPCTVITAPCKTLQRAYTVTPINGTINVLTSLDNATLAINKNITVIGDGVAIIGSIVIGTSSTNAVVTLRGLALNGAKIYTNGIRIDAAAAVHIENCTIERYTNDGIRLTGTSTAELFVSNTVSRDNTGYGLYFTDVNARATVEASRFENNGNAGLHLAAARANVTRSVASGNNNGIVLYSGTANVTESTAADNPSYGFYLGTGNSATLTSSVARGSDYGLVISGSGSSATIIDSVFTNNGLGIANSGTVTITNSVINGISNSGTLYTRQNNTVGGSYSGTAVIPYPAL